MQTAGISFRDKSLVFVLLSFLLTGCGGFEAGSFDASSSAQSLSAGKLLYERNCSGCHGAFETSAKRGRTVEEITNALKIIPDMKNVMVGPADIKLISEALGGSTLGPNGAKVRFTCTAPLNRGLTDKRMRRLSRPELLSTMTDLLNASVLADSQIQVQLGLLPTDILDMGVTDISANHADTHVEAMLNISVRAADLAFENTALRDKVFGTCAGQATVADSCAQTFIKDFGLKVYRRPLTTTESTQLFNQYKTASGVEGLKRTLIRLLLSPSLAFHLETGGTVQGNRVRLTDYEIASRLSYRLTGTMPDAALFQAAASGSLQSLATVKAQAQRLLANHPGAKARVEDFFRFYLQSDKIPDPNVAAAQLNTIDPNGLRTEMVQEMNEFVSNIVWTKKGSFKELLTSREVFPRSDRMAKILETTKVTGATPVQTSPEHAGLVLRPAMLAASEKLTKPFHRAAIVRKRMLCDKFGSPDATKVAARQMEVGDLSNLGNRERLTILTNDSQCLTCHVRINPVAFVLEGYDQLGMRRSVETTYDAMNKPAKTYAINTRVDNTLIEDDRGMVNSMQDALGLVDAMARGSTASSCFAQTVFEYQRAREFAADDFCALSEVEKTVVSGGSVLDAFAAAVVNEDILWKASGN